MPTTVESSMAIPEPSTVAAMTQRPRALESASCSVAAPVGGTPLPSAGAFTGTGVHGEGQRCGGVEHDSRCNDRTPTRMDPSWFL